ncbi:hypothetical protein [Microbacterium sp. AR7-10]|uniref:hypothetical protein n=1 Tax=Microbacterium sp. AR7-10 TaxID=1891970 RepID=UPI0008FCCEBF|nr:hypothetical protein [Microbacterium sp. AR7-10]OIU87683.1 hypothetical protein BFN01_08405 [Microbacterium sp. AR7-10]
MSDRSGDADDAAPEAAAPDPAVVPEPAVAEPDAPEAVVPELDVPEPTIPDAVIPEAALAEPVIPPAPPEEAPTRAARRITTAEKLAAVPAPASDPRLTAPPPDPTVVPPPEGATPDSYRGWTIAIYSFLALLLTGAVVTIGVLLS